MSSRKAVSKPKKRFGDCRECLICGGKTISAHLGMDVCRACSVFYRRSVGKRVYECRSNTGKCEVNKGILCRKCRFERIEKLLANSGELSKNAILADDSSPDDLRGDSDHTHRCEPSVSSDLVCCPKPVILDRVRSAYKTMCEIRLHSELLARPEPPHPLLMNEEDCPYAQANLTTMNTSNRILLSSILCFGKSAFPEFAELSKEHQWSLSVNFFYRFGPFESTYRADKHFPDDHERLFAGYTYWFTHNYDERFYKDCPNLIDLEHVKSSMHNYCKGHHTNMRAAMGRLKLAEEEFLFVGALMMWTTEGIELPDSVAAIAEKCRATTMQNLHVYFREERKMDNYAARLGELLTAIQLFDKSDLMKENFEFLRLMNVFTDDTFVYRLQREDAPKISDS